MINLVFAVVDQSKFERFGIENQSFIILSIF